MTKARMLMRGIRPIIRDEPRRQTVLALAVRQVQSRLNRGGTTQAPKHAERTQHRNEPGKEERGQREASAQRSPAPQDDGGRKARQREMQKRPELGGKRHPIQGRGRFIHGSGF